MDFLNRFYNTCCGESSSDEEEVKPMEKATTPVEEIPKEAEETEKTEKTQEEENFEQPKRKRDNKQIPTNTVFLELDPLPVIEDPREGESCALYLDGVNRYWDQALFEKFLTQRAEIKFTRVIKKKNKFDASIYFDNKEDRLHAYQRLCAARVKGKQFYVVPLRKDLNVSKNLARRLKTRTENAEEAKKDVRDRVTEWWRMPLEEQYQKKSEKYTKLIEKIIPEGSAPVGVHASPNTFGYRNKVELTVGRSFEGETVVGFNVGSKNLDVIAPIDNCLNVPSQAPEIARRFTEFLKTAKSPIFDRFENKGVWKFVVIRTTESGETMVVFAMYGRAEEEDIQRLKTVFSDITSLWVAETSSYESFGPNPKLELISGKEVIVETLRGLKFDISPLSFFQTNTPGAELLFREVEELAEIDKNTVVLDVCCGTGVIGLSLANKAKKVIGIDIEESAIEDAKKNARTNNIQNAEFIASRAELALPEILKKCQEEGSRTVVIVDPPRDGLHKDAAAALRNCELIKRIVYVSCNPESLVRDARKYLFVERPATFPTPVFQPTKYFGVDLFPHTPRLELVMLMERE